MVNATGTVEYGGITFWRTAPPEFRRFHEVAPRLQDALNELTMRREYGEVEAHQRGILNLAILIGVSMTELVVLVESGLGAGAIKMARCMLEYAVNAEYFRRFPPEFEDFLQWHWVEQKRLLDFARQYAPQEFERIPQEDRERSEAEFERVRHRFEYQTAKGPRLRSWWYSRDLAARAAITGFADSYAYLQPVGSQFIHGTFGGLAALFEPGEDVDRIAVPPSLKWCRQALVSGHLYTLKALATLASAFDVEPAAPPVRELEQDYRYAWGNPAGAA
jgi:hypothetical protein